MVFSQFNFLENDTRIIKYQNNAYKIKLIYNDCSERNLPSLTPEQSHDELEKVFRAVLYADQRDQKLPKIKTKHFLVSVLKKGWKTSEKLNFKKDDSNIKCYSYLFEFKINANPEMDVRYRSGRRSGSKHIVNSDDSDNDIEYRDHEVQRSRSSSRKQEGDNSQRSRLKTRKSDLTMNQNIKTKDCKVVLKRIDYQIFNESSSVKLNNKKKGGKENNTNRSLRTKNISYKKQKDDGLSDKDSDSELERSDKDRYSPSEESVDLANLDDIESDDGENKIPKPAKERKSPRKKRWRKLYVPKYNKSYKNPNIASDISSDSNSNLSDEEVEMSDGSFKSVESSQERTRKSNKKRKSTRKTRPNKDTQLNVSYRESSGTSSDENIENESGCELENNTKRKMNKDKNTSKPQQKENHGSKQIGKRKGDIIESDKSCTDDSSDDRMDEDDDISSDDMDKRYNSGNMSLKKISKDAEKQKSKNETIERHSNHEGRLLRKSNLPQLRKGLKKKQLKSLRKKKMISYVEESSSSEDSDSMEELTRTKRKTNKKKQQTHEVETSEEEMSSSDIIEDNAPSDDVSDEYVPSDDNADEYVPSDDNADEYVPSDDDVDEYVPSDDNADEYVPSDDNRDEYIPLDNGQLSDEDMLSASTKKRKKTNKRANNHIDLTQDKGDGDIINKVNVKEKNKEVVKDTKQETKRSRKKKNILVDENMNVENILGSFQEQNKKRSKSSDSNTSRRSRKLFTASCVPLERLPSTITGSVIIESPQNKRNKTKNIVVKRCSKSPNNEMSDKFETASMESESCSSVTPRKSNIMRKEPKELDRIDQIVIRSPRSEGHRVQENALERNMTLSRSHPGPSRRSPRKRSSSGIWNVVESIITPIKRLMTK